MQDVSSAWHVRDAASLAEMKAAAEAALAHHPDWIALNRLSDGDADSASFRERLIVALTGVPAFGQLRAIEAALAAWPETALPVDPFEVATVDVTSTAVVFEKPPLPDDLTRIRGIDPATADHLMQLGVTRFDQIAHWWPTDVQRVSEALGLGRRVTRQSWIAQAALLVKQRGAAVENVTAGSAPCMGASTTLVTDSVPVPGAVPPALVQEPPAALVPADVEDACQRQSGTARGAVAGSAACGPGGDGNGDATVSSGNSIEVPASDVRAVLDGSRPDDTSQFGSSAGDEKLTPKPHPTWSAGLENANQTSGPAELEAVSADRADFEPVPRVPQQPLSEQAAPRAVLAEPDIAASATEAADRGVATTGLSASAGTLAELATEEVARASVSLVDDVDLEAFGAVPTSAQEAAPGVSNSGAASMWAGPPEVPPSTQIMLSEPEMVIATGDVRFDHGMDGNMLRHPNHRAAETDHQSVDKRVDEELSEILALIRKSPLPSVSAIGHQSASPPVARAVSPNPEPTLRSGPQTLAKRLTGVRAEPGAEAAAPATSADRTAVSLTRMLALETELDALTADAARASRRTAPADPRADERAATEGTGSSSAAAEVGAVPCAMAVPEAEVEIVRTGAAPRVQSNALTEVDPNDLVGPSFSGAEEASVVIVKRVSGERNGRQLPFFEQALPETEQTIRKFMTALTGPAGN